MITTNLVSDSLTGIQTSLSAKQLLFFVFFEQLGLFHARINLGGRFRCGKKCVRDFLPIIHIFLQDIHHRNAFILFFQVFWIPGH